MAREIYVSVDVESDGPIPGPNSMLSLGAAAYQLDETLVDTFSANLKTLEGASGNPETMAWWETQPEAWKACRSNPVAPQSVMLRFTEWLNRLPGKPVCVCYPAGYDFTFVYWYLIKFTGKSPFGFQALDIKTLAMAVLRKPFRETSKRNMPKEWFEGLPKHTHKAVDDAIEQGALFCRIMEVCAPVAKELIAVGGEKSRRDKQVETATRLQLIQAVKEWRDADMSVDQLLFRLQTTPIKAPV